MFSFFKRDNGSAELALYGKLPLAKDYLRIGCGQGSALAVREWMDAAYSPRDSEPPRIGQPLRFLVASDPGDWVVGTIRSSSDAGGKRPFPFALLAGAPRRSVERFALDGADDLAGLWAALHSIQGELAGHADGREVLAALRSRKLEPLATSESAGTLTLSAWVRALWPDRKEAALEGVREELEGWKRDGLRGPVSLPLARGASLVHQAQAWVGALERVGWMVRGEPYQLFFPHGSGPEGALPRAFVTRGGLDLALARTLAGDGDGPGIAADGARDHRPLGETPEPEPPLSISLPGALAGA